MSDASVSPVARTKLQRLYVLHVICYVFHAGRLKGQWIFLTGDYSVSTFVNVTPLDILRRRPDVDIFEGQSSKQQPVCEDISVFIDTSRRL